MIQVVDTLVAAVGCAPSVAGRYLNTLNEGMRVYGIQAVPEFLAQLGHESGSFQFVKEIWGPTEAQKRYERDFEAPWPANSTEARLPKFAKNRLAFNLGNSEPGDGSKFRGYGLIQVTGRGNVTRCRDRLRAKFGNDVPDFVESPEKLMETRWAVFSACDFWHHNGCEALARSGDFVALTKRINGGTNGLEDRQNRLARAQKVLATAEIVIPEENAAPPTENRLEKPVEPTLTPQTVSPEPEMPLPLALPFLAKTLIDLFMPLAKEKVTKELSRHSDNPEVVAQITNAMVSTAQTLTGKTDPLEAVVAAKSQPEVVQAVQDTALDALDRLAPLLDKMDKWESAAFADSEASKTAAAARQHNDPSNSAAALAKMAAVGLYGMIGVLAILVIVQMIVSSDHKPSGELLTALTGMMMLAAGKATTVYDFFFGTSRSSGAKDTVIAELSRRPK